MLEINKKNNVKCQKGLFQKVLKKYKIPKNFFQIVSKFAKDNTKM